MNRKLYIPTSSGNFNNLLSTESISPESFYLNRNFGYKRFEKVPPNPLSNLLIAYDKIPKFELNTNDYENYPIIIEIDEDLIDSKNLKEKSNSDVKIFILDRTIYFHPNHVKFLFFSDDQLKLSLIKAEPSIETKLIPLYQTKFEVINFKQNREFFSWNSDYLKGIKDTATKEMKKLIFEDERIDKLKGFYYSYYLGKLFSPDLKISSLTQQLKKLNFLFKDQIDSGNPEQINEIINLSEEFNINLMAYKSSLSNANLNFNVDFNNSKITNIQDNIFKDRGNDLYKNIINEVLEFQIFNIQDFKEQKVALTFKIGSIFADYRKDWENSKERKYFNQLMDHIEAYKPFDLKSHTSNILQSLALFIQKGEDPEYLIENLKESQIPYFEVALGLWGSLFGFSAIPKTLFFELLSETNIDQTSLLYQEACKKLHFLNDKEVINLSPIDKTKGINQLNEPQPQLLKSIDTNDSPQCPKCGSNMTVKNGKHGKFWGCMKFPDCKGQKDYATKTKDSKRENNLSELIENYLSTNGESKISDIVDHIKSKTNKSYSVGNIDSFVKENLANSVASTKLGYSKALRKKDSQMKSNSTVQTSFGFDN